MPTNESLTQSVLVLGVGPTPPEKPARLHAPGLRLWTLARFLSLQGYDVIMAMVGFGGGEEEDSAAPPAPEKPAGTPDFHLGEIACYRLPYSIESAAHHIREIVGRYNPRCVVSTTDFMNLAAVRARLPVPLWLDFMGQPMTERQLLADVYESDEGLRGQWEYMLPSLLAADRISVCSDRQRYMMLGELGAAGRLNRHTARTNLVEVLVPFHLFETKFEHTRTVLRQTCVRADDFVVLWSGGYNTWADVDTLFAGLEGAMVQHPRIVFVSTGGEIPGHDNRTFGRFKHRVEQSPNRHRYKFCGWVPTEDVPNYYLESNVALNVDRWSIEGQVGYRTRLLDWIWAGLPVVTTVLCELSETLAAQNFITPFRIGDAHDLSIKLAALAVDCSAALEQTARARQYLKTHLDPARVLAPLAEWVADPQPAPDLPPPNVRPTLPLCSPENSLAEWHQAALTSSVGKPRFWPRWLGRFV
ncbi:MAG: glycosyltransferase [Candidatus Sumerlaeia bacterium]|nr:glycosyltransferase [Candidatus Sumerlaeia bacterium]